MRNLCLLLGANDVYAQSSTFFDAFLHISVSSKTVERICKDYGNQLETNFIQDMEATLSEPKTIENKVEPRLCVIGVDGSYVATRGEEEVWKEVKLARIDVVCGSSPSRYLAYLGGHEEFLKRLAHVCKDLKNKVFIGDGAPWFWNWVEKNYPESPQILDFYHAKSHLAEFAQAYWRKDPLQADLWLSEIDVRLKADGVDDILRELKKIVPRSKTVKEIHRKLVNYIEKNKKRMFYQTFKEQGLPIGSGAIESAHREVIQKRMKRAGQRWSKKGAQAMLELRTKYSGKQWDQVIELLKKNS